MHLGMAVTEAIVAVITAALSEMSCTACRGVYETCEGKDSRHLGTSVTGLIAMQYQGIVEKGGVHFLADGHITSCCCACPGRGGQERL